MDIRAYQGWLFDLDGVLINTAEVHAAAWKQAFDGFLAKEQKRADKTFVPFDPVADYQRYVDGEPRADGVLHFLAARGIELPAGVDDDPQDARTVAGLGNRENHLLLQLLRTSGIDVYPGVLALVKALRSKGTLTAVVSASENTHAAQRRATSPTCSTLSSTGRSGRKSGWPASRRPTAIWKAARRLGISAAEGVVVEDALAGVEAGRAGHFGLVIGVDHQPMSFVATEPTLSSPISRSCSTKVVEREASRCSC